MLVDSHCHLNYHANDGDLDDVIARAQRAGVGTMVTICTKLHEFPVVRGIAEANAHIWCSVGVHPHEAAGAQDVTTEQLVTLAAHPKVVGIGESGLDYYYERSSRGDQQACFRAHIHAARRTGLPLIVHARDADDDMIAILGEEHADGAFPGLIHCFTSGPELAEKALEIGFYISFSGIVSFKNAQSVQAVARDVPADRFLVETDSPYLAPVPNRGKRNEPAFVTHVADAIAALRDVEPAEIARLSTENFARLFNRVTMPA